MSSQTATADVNWANVVDEIETAVEDTGMIVRVGSANDDKWGMSWNDFKRAFWDTEYRTYGGPQAGYCSLAKDLVVVLDDDSWYEEADNGYFYHRWPPQLQPGFRPFEKATGQGSSSLEELNVDD